MATGSLNASRSMIYKSKGFSEKKKKKTQMGSAAVWGQPEGAVFRDVIKTDRSAGIQTLTMEGTLAILHRLSFLGL